MVVVASYFCWCHVGNWTEFERRHLERIGYFINIRTYLDIYIYSVTVISM